MKITKVPIEKDAKIFIKLFERTISPEPKQKLVPLMNVSKSETIQDKSPKLYIDSIVPHPKLEEKIEKESLKIVKRYNDIQQIPKPKRTKPEFLRNSERANKRQVYRSDSFVSSPNIPIPNMHLPPESYYNGQKAIKEFLPLSLLQKESKRSHKISSYSEENTSYEKENIKVSKDNQDPNIIEVPFSVQLYKTKAYILNKKTGNTASSEFFKNLSLESDIKYKYSQAKIGSMIYTDKYYPQSTNTNILNNYNKIQQEAQQKNLPKIPQSDSPPPQIKKQSSDVKPSSIILELEHPQNSSKSQSDMKLLIDDMQILH